MTIPAEESKREREWRGERDEETLGSCRRDGVLRAYLCLSDTCHWPVLTATAKRIQILIKLPIRSHIYSASFLMYKMHDEKRRPPSDRRYPLSGQSSRYPDSGSSFTFCNLKHIISDNMTRGLLQCNLPWQVSPSPARKLCHI